MAIYTDALFKTTYKVFGYSSANLEWYCSNFLPNSHLHILSCVTDLYALYPSDITTWRTQLLNLKKLKFSIQSKIASIFLEVCLRANELDNAFNSILPGLATFILMLSLVSIHENGIVSWWERHNNVHGGVILLILILNNSLLIVLGTTTMLGY